VAYPYHIAIKLTLGLQRHSQNIKKPAIIENKGAAQGVILNCHDRIKPVFLFILLTFGVGAD